MAQRKTIAILAVIVLVVCFGYVYAQTGQPVPRGGEAAEMERWMEQQIDMMFREIDTNHDGRISKSEWMAYYENRFKRLDKNGDGFITKDEVRADMKEERERMGRTPQKP